MLKKNDSKTENDYLKKIIDQQSDVFFEFIIGHDYNFELLFCTENIERLLGFEVYNEDFKNNFYKSILHKSDLLYFINSFTESISKVEKIDLEFRGFDLNQNLKWYKLEAVPKKNDDGTLNYTGKFIDITDIKTELEQLKISELRNSFANSASGVGVWDWNIETDEVFYSVESMKILEIDRVNNSLVSDPLEWDDKVHPDDKIDYYNMINLHFEDKIPFYETTHRIKCKSGYKWILDRGKVISRDDDGKPLRIIGTHTDVSAQKEREQSLSMTLEQVNTQKNALLNFAHIVSHNLRNHTGNLSLLIQMKEEGEFGTEEAFEFIKSVSNEMNYTVENLIDLIKVQNEQDVVVKDLNLSVALDKVFNIISEDLKSRRVNVVNYIPKDLAIKYNPAYLESILLNLTTNAIKYSKEDAEIVIEYIIDESDEFYILSVKDNGLGIDIEKHGKDLFGLYKTFHTNKNSNGIGLHITKRQIESMGGKIEVESEVEKGTTFKVYFNKS
jgi:PAS domain-containing protein/two-component sensor histidine kinase